MYENMNDYYKFLYLKSLTGAYGIGVDRERFFANIGLVYSEVVKIATTQEVDTEKPKRKRKTATTKK